PLLGLDSRPIAENLLRAGDLEASEDVRMPADHFLAHRVHDHADVELAALGSHLGVKQDLQQQVTELAADFLRLLRLEGLENLVGFLDQEWHNGFGCLFAIPRAIAAKPRPGFHEIEKRGCSVGGWPGHEPSLLTAARRTVNRVSHGRSRTHLHRRLLFVLPSCKGVAPPAEYRLPGGRRHRRCAHAGMAREDDRASYRAANLHRRKVYRGLRGALFARSSGRPRRPCRRLKGGFSGNSSTTVVCCFRRGIASCRQIGCVTEPRMPRGEARESRRADFDAEAVPHLDHLYSAAFYLCGDRDRASDLVQETFLRAFR